MFDSSTKMIRNETNDSDGLKDAMGEAVNNNNMNNQWWEEAVTMGHENYLMMGMVRMRAERNWMGRDTRNNSSWESKNPLKLC